MNNNNNNNGNKKSNPVPDSGHNKNDFEEDDNEEIDDLQFDETESSSTSNDNGPEPLPKPEESKRSNIIKNIVKRLSGDVQPKDCSQSFVVFCPESEPKEEIIICTRNQFHLEKKSFLDDLRTKRDVESFIRHPVVLFLDNNEKTIPQIINCMIKEMSGNKHSSRSQKHVINEEASFDHIQNIHKCIYDLDSLQFHNHIQGMFKPNDSDVETRLKYDETWCCAFASTDSLLNGRQIMICRLSEPTNFGPTLKSVRLLVIVLANPQEKSSKNSVEIAQTFGTLMANQSFRHRLLEAGDERKFITIIYEQMQKLKMISRKSCDTGASSETKAVDDLPKKFKFRFTFCQGIRENLSRRLACYRSDFVDGMDNWQTIQKVCSSTMTLFFACILPCVAFGVLNEHNTGGLIGPKEALIGQAVGGLLFALLAGQPLVIIATTAPLCLYTAIVHRIAENLSVNFFDLFAMVGIWNALFLTIYAMFDLSQMMKFCTRSTEEIFATFIFFAFSIDALKECVSSFNENYCFIGDGCAPEKSILFLLLMFGTFILAIMLYNFSNTPYLNSFIRTNLADYCLPVSVIVFSIIGSFAFSSVKPDSFQVTHSYRWHFATLSSLNVESVFISLILGLALSMLFFIDQNVSAALVSAPGNRLKKGDAYHWDLLVVAILNLGLSLIGYPWMHGILPHSPMHARSLADVQTTSNGEIIVVKSRETRITGLLIHFLITLVAVAIPQLLSQIPVAVLCGLFLYCAASTLRNNSLYHRILLMITEQRFYPAMQYLRKCPQRTVHIFTTVQLVQLLIICFFGFAPWEYVQLIFPLIIAMLIPIRSLLLPLFIPEHYLNQIDNKHY